MPNQANLAAVNYLIEDHTASDDLLHCNRAVLLNMTDAEFDLTSVAAVLSIAKGWPPKPKVHNLAHSAAEHFQKSKAAMKASTGAET